MDNNTFTMDTTLVFFVNGRKVVDDAVDPETTLLQYLRSKLYLTGTKLVCSEGGCGACTVMVSKFNRQDKIISHFSVNACLLPVCSLHGLAVTTVEGIGNTSSRLHPVQDLLANAHGSQCGFCTPGFVMSMYTLLRNNPQPTQSELESAFEGNLCRCTGYRPIIEGFKPFTKEYICGLGEKCCRNQQTNGELCNGNGIENNNFMENGIENDNIIENDNTIKNDNQKSVDQGQLLPTLHPSQEVVFPSELQITDEYDTKFVHFTGPRVAWYRPVTLQQLLTLKEQYPRAKLVVGNSEIGIETKFKHQVYPVIIAPSLVPELQLIELTEKGLVCGAALTLTKLQATLCDLIGKLPEERSRVFSAIVEMLRWFAGHQIRNVAAIGGNLINASPISDLNPLFMAAGCTLTLNSNTGTRMLVVDEHFFPGYRKTLLRSDEILQSILIPYTTQNEYFFGYKQSHRRDDDIAIVNAGMRVLFREGSDVIKELSLSYGGMAPITVKPIKTCQRAVGRSWSDELMSDVCGWLEDDLPLDPGAPGGSVPYRRTLTTSFFFKFYLSVKNHLANRKVIKDPVEKADLCATTTFKKPPMESCQFYAKTDSEQPSYDAVGRPITHASALKHVTGEAKYIDDMPPVRGELHLALVGSSRAHARILRVDTSAAWGVDGVHAVIDHRDVRGINNVGFNHDEEVFATDKVHFMGQTLCAVVADSPQIASRAARLVKVDYEDLPAIITIEQAIAAEAFYPVPCNSLTKGDMDKAFTECDHVLEGETRLGGQEHFYLEPQSCIAIPKEEDGEMEVFSSCQSPTTLQMDVSTVLGVPGNRIVVRVKRMGGAFGGKETRFSLVALPVVIAAQRLSRPIRCILDRDVDMAITGQRHPFLARYKIGVSKEAMILGLSVVLYSNAGFSLDLSASVMIKACASIINAYAIPNIQVSGHVCRTNLASNTAFRGFGGPQGMFVVESCLDEMATKINMSVEQLRVKNIALTTDSVWFGECGELHTRQCWEDCMAQSDYLLNRQLVDQFNRENRWKKRGLCILPTMFGISFAPATWLNQSGALVHIYKDGSVLLTHGGTEMGQGLHTKMIQVASRALGIHISRIFISETSTNTVPNTSPTAASLGSDLNGMAIMNACHELLSRLDPVKKANPKASWEELILQAYMDRISLSATGFYGIVGDDLNPITKTGSMYVYYVCGVGCSSVEIDVLTGDHQVLRTDIVMDVGNSINPAIDIGQVEGAFTQGYGLFMMEESRYSPEGFLYTRGPGMYKIPSCGDVPAVFNVTLLKGTSNARAVYSSKAVGEPPLFLSASVFFACKDAIRSARRDYGVSEHFTLYSPASAERIRMACVDTFTQQFPVPQEGTYKPWDVVV